MRKIFFVILTLVFLGCRHEIENPKWDVDIIFPIFFALLIFSLAITVLVLILFANPAARQGPFIDVISCFGNFLDLNI